MGSASVDLTKQSTEHKTAIIFVFTAFENKGIEHKNGIIFVFTGFEIMAFSLIVKIFVLKP